MILVAVEDYVKKALEDHSEIVEIQVEYMNGDKKDYSLEDEVSREAAISGLLGEVDWSQVKEIEVEYENGDKTEIDLETGELEAVDADDDDDDDNDDDDDDDAANDEEAN
jgi:hypothetical protein